MITALVNLKSTNDIDGKQIFVDALVVGSQPTKANLDYVICGNKYEKEVQLDPDQSKTIPFEHKESGKCLVKVTVRGSNPAVTTNKLLDLDAAESF
jgi:hypothetical protein